MCFRMDTYSDMTIFPTFGQEYPSNLLFTLKLTFMFDLLRKATPSMVVNMAEKAANSLLPDHVIVARIHDDFDSASTKAVEEAKRILEGVGNEIVRAQVQSLKAAGFHNVPLVKNWEADTQKRVDSEKRIAIVEKYSQKYPGQK